jgi:hypothetical protein
VSYKLYYCTYKLYYCTYVMMFRVVFFSEFVSTTKSSNPATRNTITTTSFSGHSTTEENVKQTTNVMTSMSNKENVLKKQNSSSIGKTV